MQKEKNPGSAFFWNMVGSSCYSVASFVYLMVVTRTCGVETAGFFSLSYATAQLLLTIGRYGMRTYHATDLDGQYSFRVYTYARVLTCTAMMAIGLAYSLISFDGQYILISVLVVLMKMVDAVEDLFHGQLQRTYHVETMGKLLAVRNVFSAAAFCVILVSGGSLLTACLVTAFSSLLFCLGINVVGTAGCGGFRDGVPTQVSAGRAAFRLLKYCSPIFLGTFLSLLLYNIPKYAMAGILPDEYQTYYSILFMPSFVISLLCEFLFKPTITTIARLWQERQWKRFAAMVRTILLLIAGADVMILLGGDLIGRRLLELVYGVDLSGFRLHFLVLLAGGGFSAEVYMLYNILIAVRKDRLMLPIYGLAAILTVLPVRWMVTEFRMMGAAACYLYSCFLLFVFFAANLIYVFRKNRGNDKNG